MDYKELIEKLDQARMPHHVGIIMDGNGRWAKAHNRPRLFGHRAGAKATRTAVELAVEIKLEVLTLYAFSTENWSRPKKEVDGLLKLVKEKLYDEMPVLHNNNVSVHRIGSNMNLSDEYLNEIDSSMSTTHNNSGLRLNIAFNYGGRLEVIDGIKKLYAKAELNPELIQELTPENFGDYLYTAGLPDPDFIIRTSGESRMSNFLLWQSAYSEILISPLYWPDFDKVAFLSALLDYQNRKRRFGGVKAK